MGTGVWKKHDDWGKNDWYPHLVFHLAYYYCTGVWKKHDDWGKNDWYPHLVFHLAYYYCNNLITHQHPRDLCPMSMSGLERWPPQNGKCSSLRSRTTFWKWDRPVVQLWLATCAGDRRPNQKILGPLQHQDWAGVPCPVVGWPYLWPWLESTPARFWFQVSGLNHDWSKLVLKQYWKIHLDSIHKFWLLMLGNIFSSIQPFGTIMILMKVLYIPVTIFGKPNAQYLTIVVLDNSSIQTIFYYHHDTDEDIVPYPVHNLRETQHTISNNCGIG